MQADEFKRERESVKDDPDKVIIQVDFAENFTTKLQNEVQSAYWSYKQVTLFTVCAWEQQGVHSMVIASDYLQHDKYAVNVFLRRILIFKWLDDEVRHFEKIVMFSDGAASQFKQRYLLCSLTLFSRPIVWNFFCTSHGKGPVDGIGGTAKRVVATEAMSGRVDVMTSQQFADVATQKCPNITILHVAKEDIQVVIPKLDKDLEKIRPVPKNLQIHKVTVNGPFCLEIQNHAQASVSSTHYFRKVSNEDDISQEGEVDDGRQDSSVIVGNDDSQDINVDGGNARSQNKDDSSHENSIGGNNDGGQNNGDGESIGSQDSSDEDIPMDEGDDDSDKHVVGADNENQDDSESVGNDKAGQGIGDDGDSADNQDKDDTNLDFKWVVVVYSRDKYANKFYGQVMKSDDQIKLCTVKFLKPTISGKFVWPAVDDIDDNIHRSQIIEILNEPQMDRRDTITFI